MYLLHAPTTRDLELYTALPERYRRIGVRSAWADANRGGQPTDSFLEGPVFDAAGNLYVTDIPFGRIFRIDPAGMWEQIAEWAGEPNGMKFLNDRELLVTDYKNGLMRLDLASGRQPFSGAAQQRTLQGRERPGVRQPGQPVLHRPGPNRTA